MVKQDKKRVHSSTSDFGSGINAQDQSSIDTDSHKQNQKKKNGKHEPKSKKAGSKGN